MTMIAMTRSREIFCPSELIAAGEPRHEVYTEMIKLQKDGLFCVDCYELLGEAVPLHYVDAKAARVHFRHQSRSQCVKTAGSGENERHKVSKIIVARWLRKELADYDVSVEVDCVRCKSEGVSDRKPDVVVVYPNSAREAHEIQYSRITLREIRQRTIDLIEHGFFKVVWYLGENVWDETTRAWLWDQQKQSGNVFHYKMRFLEPLNARWEEDEYYNAAAEAERERQRKRLEERQRKRLEERQRLEEQRQRLLEERRQFEARQKEENARREAELWARSPFVKGQTVWAIKADPHGQYSVVENVVTGISTSFVLTRNGNSNTWDKFYPTKEAAELAIAPLREALQLREAAREQVLQARQQSSEAIAHRWQESEGVLEGEIEATPIRRLNALIDRHFTLIPITNKHPCVFRIAEGHWTEKDQQMLLLLAKEAITSSSKRTAQLFLSLIQWTGKQQWADESLTDGERSRLHTLSKL